jgi:acyl carrier protein/surfactin synthase thioesterase subunit
MKENDPNFKLYDSLYRKLRELCKKQLTEYMIPQHFMIIQEIPLSSNGKIARDRLPKLQSIVNASSGGATNSDQSIIEPMNDLEKQIRHLFSMILNIPETTICCESQTFFTLGGNSLSSIQLLFAIRKHLEKTMTVQDLFQHSTVRKIYEFLYPQQQQQEQQHNQVDSMENNHSQSKKLFQYVLSEGKKNHPVIILFNPAGATGLCYLRYAKLLGDSFPIFAIDDGCIQNGLDFEFESIQEVASTAIPLIEDITKRFRNPSESTGKVKVILAGWSYGGVVAIEVAKLILQRSNLWKDIEVQCLSLFDSPVTAPIFSSPSGSQNDDFPVELLSSTNNSNNSNGTSNSTSSMDSLIQQMTRTHFDKCTALLELYYRSPVDPAEFSCPIHDIRAEKSNYFIPLESITNLVVPSALSSVERTVIPGGDHWNIITGDYVQQTAQESVQFWKKYLLSK